LRNLLTDLEQRNLDRRSFIRRGTALGLSTRAMATLLGTSAGSVAMMSAHAQDAGTSFTRR
jgi:hypothetical protein